TPKALYITVQGRESASAPWVAIDDEAHTLKEFHNGSTPSMMRPFQGRFHVDDNSPGCARRLATLGCVIERLRRTGRPINVPPPMAIIKTGFESAS
ncbi:MAG: hypothetical protein SH850_29745, partial [Planctomycetaceae bacterium]|nr:hypothetical protein [Planctomycetaceae bacterium]